MPPEMLLPAETDLLMLDEDWNGTMTVDVPQAILDALTDVDMPRLMPERAASETIDVGGYPRARFIATAASSSAAGRPACARPSSSAAAAATW